MMAASRNLVSLLLLDHGVLPWSRHYQHKRKSDWIRHLWNLLSTISFDHGMNGQQFLHHGLKALLLFIEG